MKQQNSQDVFEDNFDDNDEEFYRKLDDPNITPLLAQDANQSSEETNTQYVSSRK